MGENQQTYDLYTGVLEDNLVERPLFATDRAGLDYAQLLLSDKKMQNLSHLKIEEIRNAYPQSKAKNLLVKDYLQNNRQLDLSDPIEKDIFNRSVYDKIYNMRKWETEKCPAEEDPIFGSKLDSHRTIRLRLFNRQTGQYDLQCYDIVDLIEYFYNTPANKTTGEIPWPDRRGSFTAAEIRYINNQIWKMSPQVQQEWSKKKQIADATSKSIKLQKESEDAVMAREVQEREQQQQQQQFGPMFDYHRNNNEDDIQMALALSRSEMDVPPRQQHYDRKEEKDVKVGIRVPLVNIDLHPAPAAASASAASVPVRSTNEKEREPTQAELDERWNATVMNEADEDEDDDEWSADDTKPSMGGFDKPKKAGGLFKIKQGVAIVSCQF